VAKRRVVVTGLGLVTSLGHDVASSWSGIVSGKSGITKIQEFDASEFPVTFAGEVKSFDPQAFLDKKDVKKMDGCIHYAIKASIEAIADAGLDCSNNEELCLNTGVSIGSGIGGLTTIQDNAAQLSLRGPRKISPFFIPASIVNMSSGHVAIKFGFKGPNIAIATACTTGTHSIGYGARTIAYGDADVMVCGGTEKGSCALGVAGFSAARALSRRNDDPQAASRPWDKDRDGFVLGDGAGILVLEEYEHAKKRGAKIYAELSGFGMSADAYHMTLPSGEGGYRSMCNAMSDSGLSVGDIDYINAHGTSTPAGDVVESQSIEKFIKDPKSALVSSTKSMVGHLLGGAGAVEAVFSVLSMRDNIAPPTINLDNIDENCNLDYVPNEARDHNIDVVMSNSFGFGGTNGTLIFKRV
jgi:3-oxoacyl-[acyl-carrier-protein] synthase II